MGTSRPPHSHHGHLPGPQWARTASGEPHSHARIGPALQLTTPLSLVPGRQAYKASRRLPCARQRGERAWVRQGGPEAESQPPLPPELPLLVVREPPKDL